MPHKRQLHQLCTAVLLRDKGDLILVREKARLFLAPGNVVVNRLMLNLPGGGVKKKDSDFSSFRYAISREGMEEIGMPPIDNLADVQFQGVYATYRAEFEEKPLVTYLVYRATVPESMRFEPSPGNGIEEIVRANSSNIDSLRRETPWRMSWLNVAWDDFWADRIRSEPYLELNQPVYPNIKDLCIRA